MASEKKMDQKPKARKTSIADRKNEVVFKEEEHVQKLRHKEEERGQRVGHEDGDAKRQEKQETLEQEKAVAQEEAQAEQEKVTGPDYAAMGEQELFGTISPVGMGGQMQQQQMTMEQQEMQAAEPGSSGEKAAMNKASSVHDIFLQSFIRTVSESV